MDRKDFIILAAGAGLAVMLPGCGSQAPSPQAQPAVPPAAKPAAAAGPAADLVVAKGSDPDGMLSQGLATFGGIGRFVKPGHIVVIKPNFSVPRLPEEAATTNNALVSAVVRACSNCVSLASSTNKRQTRPRKR